jgi:hypothetical protein
VTAQNQPQQLQKNNASPVAEAPKAILKPEETAEVISANEKKKARPE